MPATFRSCEPDRMLLPALAVRGEPAEGRCAPHECFELSFYGAGSRTARTSGAASVSYRRHTVMAPMWSSHGPVAQPVRAADS